MTLCAKGEPGPAGAPGETGFPGSVVKYHLRSFQSKKTHILKSSLWLRMYITSDWKVCCRVPEVFQDYQVIQDWKDTRWVSLFSPVEKEADVELWPIYGWSDRETLVYWGPGESQEPLDPRSKAHILLLAMVISCRSRTDTLSVFVLTGIIWNSRNNGCPWATGRHLEFS